MAYTINMRHKIPLAAGIVMIVGDYSGVNADTTTLTLPGGFVVAAIFTDANNNPITTQALSAKALSGANTTYTLTSTATVTNGGFAIITGGN